MRLNEPFLGLCRCRGQRFALLLPLWRRRRPRTSRRLPLVYIPKHGAHSPLRRGGSAVDRLLHLASLRGRVSSAVRSTSCDPEPNGRRALCRFPPLRRPLPALVVFLSLRALAPLSLHSLLPRLASRGSLLCGLLRGGRLPVAARPLVGGRLARPVFRVRPMRGAPPLCLLAELSLEVGPDVLDARQLALKSLVGCADDVILLVERHEHVFYLRRRAEEQLPPWRIGLVIHRRPVRLADRGAGVVMDDHSPRPVLGARRSRARRRGARRRRRGRVGGDILRRRGGVEACLHEVLEVLLRRGALCVDLLQEREVADELLW